MKNNSNDKLERVLLLLIYRKTKRKNKMETEIWKDIEGYEGHYQVSDKGRIKSVKFGKEIFLKPGQCRGYLHVGLSKNGEYKQYTVHRLVCQAFLPNSNNLPEINHKDEIKTNNNIENLEWCDHKYNINFGNRTQIQSEKCSKPVLQYTKTGKFVKEWKSVMDVERNLGYSEGHISACSNEKRKSAYGFVWKFKKS